MDTLPRWTRPGFLPIFLCLLAMACQRRQPDDEAIAGLYAIQGEVTVESDRLGNLERRAKVGMSLSKEMSLRLGKGARVAVEGFNGEFLLLDREGRHSLRKLKPLKASPKAERRVRELGLERARERDVGSAIPQARYEPLLVFEQLRSGGGLFGGGSDDDSLREGLAFFFLPKREEKEVPMLTPQAGQYVVRALSRPLQETRDGRQLVAAEGTVVIEFQDRATAFASSLDLPLDLGDVARLLVFDGKAEVALPEERVHLRSGEEAIVQRRQ